MHHHKIKLCISTCLLGKKVRYDGDHKIDHWAKNYLQKYAKFIPICPEHECGLSIPRDPMHLESTSKGIKLIITKSREDVTPLMNRWIKKQLNILKKINIDGYIFKAKSPSCGIEKINSINSKTKQSFSDKGIFAQAIINSFPFLPVIDEVKLKNKKNKENFIDRIFIMKSWRELIKEKKSINKIKKFHSKYEFIIMAHSGKHNKLMKKILLNTQKDKISSLYNNYFIQLYETFKLFTTIHKNTLVLKQIMGHFKFDLSNTDKQLLKESISKYNKEFISLIEPITIINHFIKKYNKTYLKEQLYLNLKNCILKEDLLKKEI